MAVSVESWLTTRFAFTANEFTGALGDSITVLPIVVALGTLTPAPLALILLLFGAFQIVWGLRYGLPVSVEPMKALAGLAIAGTLAYGELLTAGLLAGVVLLVVGATGTLGHVRRYVGRPVVRGVQFAVALLLARTGLRLVAADLRMAALGTVVALVVAAVGYRRAAALAVLGAGTAWTLVTGGLPGVTVPTVSLFPAGAPVLTVGAVEGTVAQLAMTVGNAAVATSLLLDDLFDADVSADQLATSMGSMNLFAVPLGGLPMCHGSGGLAGKYAFGARTGGANVVLGLLYVAAALVAGVWLGFPVAVLGVLLGVIAVQLGRVAFETDRPLVVAGIGVLALLTNVGIAFVAGLAYWLAEDRLADRWVFLGNARKD